VDEKGGHDFCQGGRRNLRIRRFLVKNLPRAHIKEKSGTDRDAGHGFPSGEQGEEKSKKKERSGKKMRANHERGTWDVDFGLSFFS
jgi:hypothetical protein